MEIGNQIKALRNRRGITQDALAQQLGVTAQAVSKWERGAATPDIGMLPDISAFFGVTIDELFALSDDTRMERIQNMLWDLRYIPQTEVDTAREFLLEKARREPNNGNPHALLAELENHIAKYHHDMAAEYAKNALQRDHTIKVAHSALTEALNGSCGDWNVSNHHEAIQFYKEFVDEHPTYISGYLWLLDPLIEAGRLNEASVYCERMAQIDRSFRTPFYRGYISLMSGKHDEAEQHFSQMCQLYADDWCTWLSMGDIYARTGEYEKAKSCYRKSLTLQAPPRFTDALTSIAQICEAQGDYEGAIQATKDEIALLESDWDTKTGETVDQFYRTISRLEKNRK